MRKLVVLAAAIILIACTPKNENDIVVNIEAQNMTLSKVGLLVDRTTAFTVDLDKNGKGSVVIPGLGNIYAHVVYGQDTQDIFLQKGEEATLHFDAREFKNSLRVEGRNAAANEYLKNSQLLPAPQEYNLSWAEYSVLLNARIDEMTQLLHARNLQESCPEFVKTEEGRILYNYNQAMIMYPMGHALMTGNPEYTPEPALLDAMRALVEEREELADVEAYREFMVFATNMLATGAVPTGNAYARTVASMKYIAETFTNAKVKQTLLRSLALEYLQANGIRNTEELQNLVNAYITDAHILQEFKNEYARHDLAAPGRLSPDFSARDVDGKAYSLKDFNGKYLFIDMWATWCGPCRQELPYLKALEEKFQGRNITFLGLSTDKDAAAWEEMVRAGKLSGTQLLLGTGSQFQQDYNVDNIPRFILLDKQGQIVNANMLHPSDEGIEQLLEKLDGI